MKRNHGPFFAALLQLQQLLAIGCFLFAPMRENPPESMN